MPDYDAYLFDLDGTLIDSAPDLAYAVNLCLKRYDCGEVEVQSVRNLVGQGATALLRSCFESVGAPTPDDAMLKEFIDNYSANPGLYSEPYQGVQPTLKNLHAAGKKLAVVTNKYHYLAVPVLDSLGLADYFNVIVGAETANKPKPAPDPIYYACQQLGTNPTASIMIGDSTHDYRSAAAAGADYAQVTYGYKEHGELPADLPEPRLINSLEDLLS